MANGTAGASNISEDQLSEALVNWDYKSFARLTVNMMVNMFDSDHSQTLNYSEFSSLWNFLEEWQKIFIKFDIDGSRAISPIEFRNTLKALKYSLPDECVDRIFYNYVGPYSKEMNFDIYVQACITIKRLTDTFKQYDSDRDGVIEIKFADYITSLTLLMSSNGHRARG